MFSASQSDGRQTGCQSGGFNPQGYGSSSRPQLLGTAMRKRPPPRRWAASRLATRMGNTKYGDPHPTPRYTERTRTGHAIPFVLWAEPSAALTEIRAPTRRIAQSLLQCCSAQTHWLKYQVAIWLGSFTHVHVVVGRVLCASVASTDAATLGRALGPNSHIHAGSHFTTDGRCIVAL
jgi:hypothetical protein